MNDQQKKRVYPRISADTLVWIYGLRDPRDGRTRYIGQSHDPKGRFKAHLYRTDTTPKSAWIQDLHDAGLVPEIVLIESTSGTDASEAEVRQIQRHMAMGEPLLNVALVEETTTTIAPEPIAYQDLSKASGPVKIMVRIPIAVHEDLKRMAKEQDRSVSWLMRSFVMKQGRPPEGPTE